MRLLDPKCFLSGDVISLLALPYTQAHGPRSGMATVGSRLPRGLELELNSGVRTT
jgi:hypothetical protein